MDVTNLRSLLVYGGNLFVSSGSTGFIGINQVGTGLPTTGSQIVVPLPGFPSGGTVIADASYYDFYFADANTIYVGDDRTTVDATTTGGLHKWTLSGGTWTKVNTFRLERATITGAAGLRGLTGIKNASNQNVLYATSTDGRLVTLTDNGPSSTFTVLATAEPFTNFRGVALLPAATSSSATVSGTIELEGCEQPQLVPVKFEFKPVGGGTTILKTANLTANGGYSLSGIPTGNYDITIKSAINLRRIIRQSITGSTATLNAMLLAGDSNDDDFVDLFDLDLFIQAFGSMTGDPTYIIGADFTCDGFVDIFDFNYLITNFGLFGDGE